VFLVEDIDLSNGVNIAPERFPLVLALYNAITASSARCSTT
jgi:hypothetical protein